MNMMTAAWHLAEPTPKAEIRPTIPPLLRDLPAQQREAALAAFTELRIVDGAALPSELIGPLDFAILVEGCLREDMTDANCETGLLGLTFAGEAVMPEITGREGATTLRAIGPVTLLHCPAARFHELLSEMPQLRAAYVEAIHSRLAEARRWQVLLGAKRAAARVASLLAWFWDRQGRLASLDLHLGRRELGQLTFLTLETFSRQIKALERTGAIALPSPGRVEVLNPDLLLAEAGSCCAARLAA